MRDITLTLLWFAGRMAYKLQQNDHKGSWREYIDGYLIKRLEDEVAELVEAMEADPLDIEAVVNEAADVANFAMMLADVAKQRSQT